MFRGEPQNVTAPEWSRASAEREPFGPCLHELIAARAAAAPEALAVAGDSGDPGGHEELSFGRLDRLANGLALRLRALGVGPEVPVALALDRSPAAVVAILGVLKAGGAYVILDSTYPDERLAWLLADSRAPVVVTSAAFPAPLASRTTSEITRWFDALSITFDGTTTAATDWISRPSTYAITPRKIAFEMSCSGHALAKMPKGSHRMQSSRIPGSR